MKILTFMGHSDDTFEISETGDGYDNCASGEPIRCIVVAEGKSLVITGQYSRFDNGCWDISIGMEDEEAEFPDWDIKFGFKGYSTTLKLVVPDKYILRWFDGKEEIKME